MSKKHYRPPSLNRDHARPRTAPAPSDEAVEARLTELISPATYALADHYRSLGLRWRVLTLPVMVALVLAIIWRQVASVSDAARLLSRERLLWTPPTRVSQQALSQRLGSMPAQLFSAECCIRCYLNCSNGLDSAIGPGRRWPVGHSLTLPGSGWWMRPRWKLCSRR